MSEGSVALSSVINSAVIRVYKTLCNLLSNLHDYNDVERKKILFIKYSVKNIKFIKNQKEKNMIL